MSAEPQDVYDMTLEECVKGFLNLAMLPPEKEPKTQRAQRDNRMLIIGFNRAQETFRTILAHRGTTNAVRSLGDERAEGQERPMDGPGGMKMWVA